jgi:hypothetical protein
MLRPFYSDHPRDFNSSVILQTVTDREFKNLEKVA